MRKTGVTLIGTALLLSTVMPSRTVADAAKVNHGTLTDIDGNVYRTVVIGNLEWMAGNLRVTRFADGSAIPTGLPDAEVNSKRLPSCAAMPFDRLEELAPGHMAGVKDFQEIRSQEHLVEIFGLLYNWYTLNDPRGIAPEGWRVATDNDWKILEGAVDSQHGPQSEEWNRDSYRGSDAGKKLRSKKYFNMTGRGTDEYGFSSLPSGIRESLGEFKQLGNLATYWTASTEGVTWDGDAWARTISSYDDLSRHTSSQREYYSVRLVRDVAPQP